MKSFIISSKDENQRVDKYINKILGKATKSFIYKMIRKKNIKLNDKKIEGNELLKQGDELKLFFSDETFDLFKTEFVQIESVHINNLDIIYEDEQILVCNKPVGLLSQPDGKNESLVQQIEAYLHQEKSIFKPGICNRLDRNTSGVVVAGKTVKALQVINQAIAHRKVDKTYITIVKGVIITPEKIDGYLVKNTSTNKVSITKNKVINADYIQTLYQPLKNNGQYTLLEVKIITGKTHQIRAHLESIGHPIIGDIKYGDKKTNIYFDKNYNLKYQLLHAYKYTVVEISEPYLYLLDHTFIAPIPEQFEKIVKELFEAKS